MNDNFINLCKGTITKDNKKKCIKYKTRFIRE